MDAAPAKRRAAVRKKKTNRETLRPGRVSPASR
jgi:hypothetical protein